MSEIKSGEDFLRCFFKSIDQFPKVNQKLAYKLKELYKNGKFTDTNIKNMLDELIEEEVRNEN